jgi:hypothetical protein
VPKSLERLLVNIIDYSVVPQIQGTYTSSICKF